MKVSCLNNISELGLNTFSKDYNITEATSEAELILVRSFDMHNFSISNNLLAVARAGAGVNNIPLEKMADKGVVVFNTPGANSNGVKELVIAGMLLTSRDLIGGINWVKENKTDKDILKTIEKAKKAFAGNEILGKTILVIGLGAIGGKVANSCDDLGMKVIGYDPYISDDSKDLLNNSIEINNNLDETYPLADFISLHLPLLDSTKDMINQNVFSKLKEGCVILNFSRDGLVNNLDLQVALANRIVKKYVTDFPNQFVANLENVIAFPHLGASTEESEENCAIMAAKQLMDYVEQGSIVNSVNYPNVNLERLHTGNRLIILADNHPSIAREIAKVFVGYEENMVAKISKVRGNYAFYAYDINVTIPISILANLESVKGINRVRIIK
jgi:D-3-phosphoglycerate dehydrogenase / 2-oxoglutarate reductase